MKRTYLALFTLFLNHCIHSQSIERIAFSSVASSNNSFQSTVGAPYTLDVKNSNGSIEITSEYSHNVFKEIKKTDSTNSISNPTTFNSIAVFPNPTSNFIHIRLSSNFDYDLTFAVYTIDGKKKLERKSNNSETTIDISGFGSGTYILVISTKNTEKITYKIVKL